MLLCATMASNDSRKEKDSVFRRLHLTYFELKYSSACWQFDVNSNTFIIYNYIMTNWIVMNQGFHTSCNYYATYFIIHFNMILNMYL